MLKEVFKILACMVLVYLFLIFISPFISIWFLTLYIWPQIISIIILLISIYIIVKKTKLKDVSLKILAIIAITFVFSFIAYLIFGWIMQSQTHKLVDKISYIETYIEEPGDASSNIIPKSAFENSMKFVNDKTIFSKGTSNAKVTLKNGESIITKIYCYNTEHPIIKIYNYNYMLY